MALGGSLNLDNLSDQTFDLLCRICKRKGNNSEAEKYCLECQDYFCLKCVKVHEDIPSITGHKIIDKSQIPSVSAKIVGSRKTLSDKSIERCDKHSHNGIDMYCQNHDQVGCGTCMTLGHRNCQDTFYIPEYISDTGLTTSIKQVEEKLNSVSVSLTRQHESIKNEQDQLLERKKLLLDNITKFRKEINDRLDDIEKVTISDADNTYKWLTNEMKNAMRMLQTMKETIAGYREKMKSNSNNQTTRFVTLKIAEDIDHTASKLENELKKGESFGNIGFEAAQKLSTLLKDMNSYYFTAQQPSQRNQHPQQPCQPPPQKYQPPPQQYLPPPQQYQPPSQQYQPQPQQYQPLLQQYQPPLQQYQPPPQQYQPQSQQYQPPPQQYQPPPEPHQSRDDMTGKGMVCKAVYDYDAADADEVGFREGDLILYCQPIDAGWMVGTVKSTRKRGMFPSNYVGKIN